MNIKLPAKETIILFFILLLSLFLYTWKIGDIVFVDEDEAIYAEIGREMQQSGDWITPHWNFEVFHDKQPLVYWFMALSFMIFGINEFAVRFWHSLIAVLEIYILYLIGKELFDKKTALLSSVIFATFFFYFYQARSPLMDIPLNMFISLSLYFFIRFFKTTSLFYHYLSWVSIGLAAMTKGLIGLVLPSMIIFTFLIIKGRKELDIKKYFLHTILGFMIFLLISAPWHIIEWYLYGDAFIKNVFENLTFLRYLKGVGENSPAQPFFTHFITILYGCLPWSGFLPSGLLLLLKDKDKGGRKYIIFVWVLVIFLFFSFSAPKRIRYILPLFPALGLILGHLWHSYLNSEEKDIKKYMSLSAILSLPLGVLIIGAIIYAKMKFPEEFASLAILYSSSYNSCHRYNHIGNCPVTSSQKRGSHRFYSDSPVYVPASFTWFTSAYFNQIRPIKIFARMINERIKEDDRIAGFVSLYPSLIFYTNHKVEYLHTREDLSSFLNSPHRVFCMVEAKDLNLTELKNLMEKRFLFSGNRLDTY